MCIGRRLWFLSCAHTSYLAPALSEPRPARLPGGSFPQLGGTNYLDQGDHWCCRFFDWVGGTRVLRQTQSHGSSWMLLQALGFKSHGGLKSNSKPPTSDPSLSRKTRSPLAIRAATLPKVASWCICCCHFAPTPRTCTSSTSAPLTFVPSRRYSTRGNRSLESGTFRQSQCKLRHSPETFCDFHTSAMLPSTEILCRKSNNTNKLQEAGWVLCYVLQALIEDKRSASST